MTARRTPSRRRWFRRAAVTAVVAAGAVGVLAPGAPASAAPPQPGPYEQTTRCISDLPTIEPLAEAVSAPQRTLGYTGLWDLSRGSGVTVAVIDTGVTPGPSFGDRLVGGGDLIDTGSLSDHTGLDDCDGHGTLVAGIIAGAADPRTGFAGVAPDARILSIRQNSEHYRLRDGQTGSGPGPDRTLAEAIAMAVDQGASVINISADACGPAATTNNTALTEAVRRAVDADVVVVVAAGNLGSGQSCSTQNTPGSDPVTGATPANIGEALTVGAVTSSGEPAEYSLAGTWVDLAAPGDDVVSTNPHRDGRGQVDRIVTANGVATIQGTSFAAAYVSGTVALVRARYPDLSARQVMDRMVQTADHPAGPGERTIFVGAGVVNPRMALTAVLPAEEGVMAPPAAARPAALPAGTGAATEATARRVSLLGAGAVVLALLAGLAAVVIRRRGATADQSG